MGLRQLYFLIGGLMQKLVYLTEGLSVILAFIGVKLILEASDSQGWKVPQISLSLSLVFIVVVLALTAAISLIKAPKQV
jgi:tellurite resistance protein TerC